MADKWRPKGWENPFAFVTGEPIPKYEEKHHAYEEGADAMVEAIWELAKESPTGTFVFDSKVVCIYGE